MKQVPIVAISFVAAAGAAAQAQAQPQPQQPSESGLGVHVAVGTDVNLGLGLGLGVTWLIDRPSVGYLIEAGGQLFYAHSTESSTEGIHEYDETTDLTVLAARANILLGYRRDAPATFYSVGGGAAAVSVEWEERSPTDVSLGTPLPDGGSMQAEDGTATGLIVSAGIGHSFGGGAELRLEIPILIFFNDVGEAAAFVPTLTATLGYRF